MTGAKFGDSRGKRAEGEILWGKRREVEEVQPKADPFFRGAEEKKRVGEGIRAKA